MDKQLTDTTVDYLKTANIATARHSAEQQFAELAKNATPEQRELLESISNTLTTLKRGEDNLNTAFANGDAYQEAVQAALAKNPELVESTGWKRRSPQSD